MFVIWIKKKFAFYNGLIDKTDGFIGTSKDLLSARRMDEEETKMICKELDKLKEPYAVLKYC